MPAAVCAMPERQDAAGTDSRGGAGLPPARRDPAWRGRLAFVAIGVALLWPMLAATEFTPWIMFDARSLRVSARFVAGFFPPATGPDFLAEVARASWRTLAIATCGVVLALPLAVALALLSTAALSVSRLGGRMAALPFALRQSARLLMIALRTVPELVWALVLVRVVGLGPTAGVLAIALTYTGLLGKVYAEILESADPHAARSLLINGCGRLQAFLHGLLPGATPELTSYTVYRWECAIRSSVVLGFVGAGGLGQLMDSSVKMLAGGEVATLVLVFVVLVAAADRLSAWLRRAQQ
jgi:phosphonate transport system permease protein